MPSFTHIVGVLGAPLGTFWDVPKNSKFVKKIIELYESHATSEQFHSEIKTDLDMERLPSGKFSVNALALTCAGMAYNILRLVGQ